MTDKKVVVIGLDGATWDLIKPWADKGELPTFKKLMENDSIEEQIQTVRKLILGLIRYLRREDGNER